MDIHATAGASTPCLDALAPYADLSSGTIWYNVEGGLMAAEMFSRQMQGGP